MDNTVWPLVWVVASEHAAYLATAAFFPVASKQAELWTISFQFIAQMTREIMGWNRKNWFHIQRARAKRVSLVKLVRNTLTSYFSNRRDADHPSMRDGGWPCLALERAVCQAKISSVLLNDPCSMRCCGYMYLLRPSGALVLQKKNIQDLGGKKKFD